MAFVTLWKELLLLHFLFRFFIIHKITVSNIQFTFNPNYPIELPKFADFLSVLISADMCRLISSNRPWGSADLFAV